MRGGGSWVSVLLVCFSIFKCCVFSCIPQQLTQQALKSQIVPNAEYQENHIKTITVTVQSLRQLHTIIQSVLNPPPHTKFNKQNKFYHILQYKPLYYNNIKNKHFKSSPKTQQSYPTIQNNTQNTNLFFQKLFPLK